MNNGTLAFIMATPHISSDILLLNTEMLGKKKQKQTKPQE